MSIRIGVVQLPLGLIRLSAPHCPASNT